MDNAGELTNLGAALIGAGAVLVGVLVTTLSTIWLDSQRAKREREAEDRTDQRQLRLAVRLVMEELADSEGLLREAHVQGYYWRGPRMLSTAVWTEYRTTLAEHIESPLTWRMITMAFDEVNRLNWLVQRGRAAGSPVAGSESLVRVELEHELHRAWQSMRGGIRELEQLIGVMGPASRMLGEEDEMWPPDSGPEDPDA